jgi:protein-tyrosine phosphatase
VVRAWDAEAAGVLRLPSGGLIRGRGLGQPRPAGQEPTFALYLLDDQPPGTPWPARWVRWPDFGLPADPADAASAFAAALARAPGERVEVACWGGNGRTGTALACIAILDGVPVEQAVGWVREHYRPHAVETAAQQRYVRRFGTTQNTTQT